MKTFLKLLSAPLALALASCSLGGSAMDEVTYTYDEGVLRNPERGWYVYNGFNFRNGALPEPITSAYVKEQSDRGITIIHTIYQMYDYVDKPLSQELLDIFEANMNAIRDGGAKCLLRFAYSSSYDTANDLPIKNSDAPFDVFAGHIAQLKPLLQKHGDVLYAMEAGFVGAWGEWYYSSHYNFKPKTVEAYAPRRALLDKLLDAVPTDRMICLRSPEAKLLTFDVGIADSVTLSTAFNGSDISRLAGHNDCFVASIDDLGTFHEPAQRDYWGTETKYLIMGGETCRPSDYSGCENTIAEMEKYHFSYLNSNYNRQVISGWEEQDCYDEIDRRLGFRLSLAGASFTANPSPGKPFEVSMDIKSDGFAGPINPRDAEIVFVEKGSTAAPVRMKLDADPRYWFAGQTHKVNASLDVSSLKKGGSYDVFLNLPDPEPALNTRPEYSIRLANTGVWDESTGYNKLHEITL